MCTGSSDYIIAKAAASCKYIITKYDALTVTVGTDQRDDHGFLFTALKSIN